MTQFPMIHLNGTAAQDLFDPLALAIDALVVARRRLQACAPHGRDYYPINDTAINVAMTEHYRRIERLTETVTELEAIADSVREQQEERNARGQ